jgi:hypothetical protein
VENILEVWSTLPECPICSKKLEWRGSNSYKKHIQEEHYSYWQEARRFQRLAVLTLTISLALTFLVATTFFSYNPDATAYLIIGLAALFLAFSSAFTFKERALPKKYGKSTRQRKKKQQ